MKIIKKHIPLYRKEIFIKLEKTKVDKKNLANKYLPTYHKKKLVKLEKIFPREIIFDIAKYLYEKIPTIKGNSDLEKWLEDPGNKHDSFCFSEDIFSEFNKNRTWTFIKFINKKMCIVHDNTFQYQIKCNYFEYNDNIFISTINSQEYLGFLIPIKNKLTYENM